MGCGAGRQLPEDPGPDYDFGSSPILRDLPGGKRVLVCGQKSGIVWGLDPDQRGKVLWQTRVGQGSPLGGIEWGPTADLENAYVAVSDLTVRGGTGPGGLHAVKLSTGEKVWTTPPPELHCTRRREGLHRRAIGRDFLHSGRGVLGLDRRALPRLSSEDRRDRLGLRYRARFRNRERRPGKGRLARFRRPGDRQRHGLHQLRLRHVAGPAR